MTAPVTEHTPQRYPRTRVMELVASQTMTLGLALGFLCSLPFSFVTPIRLERNRPFVLGLTSAGHRR